MTIDIISLFPDMFRGPFDMSMLWKAQEKGLAKIQIHDLRQYGLGPRRTVDDTPYGGGDGMVLRCEPVVAAIEAVRHAGVSCLVVLLTPSGVSFKQVHAASFAELDQLILICGHYEGFDERILRYVDLELSIGDFVLTGGELPAMMVTDAVVRLIPGVLGGEASAHEESFTDPMLVEYPHYTRPVDFRGDSVPEVLQSGHHAEIIKWRTDQARRKTARNRPDLRPTDDV
jgi:tRNA (guanine37-N1)-methyltransferase